MSRVFQVFVQKYEYFGANSFYFCTKCTNDGHKGSNRYRNVTHCVFDLDGTLVNSEATYHKILRQICKKYGATYSLEFQNEIYGRTNRKICTAVAERLKLPISPDQLISIMRDLSKKYMPISPLQKGALRLLQHLYDNTIPIALVTNSTKEDVNLLQKVRPEMFSLFLHKVCSNDPDVARPKPHPDPYLTATKRFADKPKPEKCLAFEDSPTGVKAAVDANMQVVMIPRKRIEKEETENATIVIESLLEFQPEMFGLPPFTDHSDDKRKKK